MRKVSDQQREEIRQAYLSSDLTLQQVGEAFGVSINIVWRAVNLEAARAHERETYHSKGGAQTRKQRRAHALEASRMLGREKAALWRAQNPEQNRAIARKAGAARRVRLSEFGAGYSAEQWVQVVEHVWGNACAYCKRPGELTQDHVVPLSRGGRHEAANLVPACRTCNSSKCDKLLHEWLWSQHVYVADIAREAAEILGAV